MRKIYFLVFFLTLFLIVFERAIAATPTPPVALSPVPIQKQVNVSANVGRYLLSLSGIIAPNASVTLIGKDTPIKATVADSNGKFSISNILVATGFSNICFDAIDIKRYGESYTCITIPPVTQNSTISDIFLPPTVGLLSDQINQGQNLLVRGYSMPSSYVAIHLSDNRTVYIQTNKEGYYQISIPMPKAGRFELFANATYQNRSSYDPTRKKSFIVFNFAEQFGNLLKKLFTPPLVWIWLILAVIILIIILLRKFKPDVFDKFLRWLQIIFPFLKKKKKGRPLHHDWMLNIS